MWNQVIAVKAGWRKPEKNQALNKGPNQDKIQSRKPEKFRWRSRMKTEENGCERIAESQDKDEKKFADKAEGEKVVSFDKTFQGTRQEEGLENQKLISSPDLEVEKKVQ